MKVSLVAAAAALLAGAAGADSLERQFLELPKEARRLTGPLFWLHGDDNETPERLGLYLEKVAEGGNGCFTAESRPHKDWLGEGWYRDLDICLKKAKQLDLKMWIFDEKWWPSQGVGGNVPARYAAKSLDAGAVDVEGPSAYRGEGFAGERYIAAVAGRLSGDRIEGDTLVDLSGHIAAGKLAWQVPAGRWRVIKFVHKQAPGLGQQGGKQLSVDGASRDCVEWFLQTVYQPHADRFKADFGKAIPGFFYDEPETRGDWGTELDSVLKERGVDWKKAYVAYAFKLTGDDDAAARYQYMLAFAEAWGRTMYGGMTAWCRERGVQSIGHFMEHGYLYYHPDFCAGDMMLLQKYSDMGGIDLVCRQMYPGQRPHSIYQTPKLGSSISHVYGKKDHVAMCEIFGGYDQALTYPQMKWLADQHQVRGINFMIPHSFNPKAPCDHDYPPYFYNSGFEPRWPLYRVWADYTSRLSLLLTGGKHVCPVAVLFSGNTLRVGKTVTPEDLTSALQDALYDCDWMPLEVFENDAKLAGGVIALHDERYRVLVVPAAEVITYPALLKARDFFHGGGTVVGYGLLPSRSGTVGRGSAEIAALREEIWGSPAGAGTVVCKKTAKGGRSYFLPEKPTALEISSALHRDGGVPPVLEVLQGETGGWLHVLHRVKEGRDVFFVCNQNHAGGARSFTLRVTAAGEPECWDAMRGELTAVPYTRVSAGQVDVSLTLEPSESALLVFQAQKRALPQRREPSDAPPRAAVAVARVATPPELVIPSRPPAAPAAAAAGPSFSGCEWVWGPEGSAARSAPPGVRYFRGSFALPPGRKVKQARFVGTCDNAFTLCVNGRPAGKSSGEVEGWREPTALDVAAQLAAGRNVLAIAAVNLTDVPSPAGLIGKLEVVFEEGAPLAFSVDATWRTSDKEQAGWDQPGFDDAAWPAAKSLGAYGCAPWGSLADGARRARRITESPVASDPFVGRCELPADLNLAQSRVFVEMDEIAPEEAARVTVNGQYAGGFIGRPLRLDVTRWVKPGANAIIIEPFAPKSVKLTIWPKG